MCVCLLSRSIGCFSLSADSPQRSTHSRTMPVLAPVKVTTTATPLMAATAAPRGTASAARHHEKVPSGPLVRQGWAAALDPLPVPPSAGHNASASAAHRAPATLPPTHGRASAPTSHSKRVQRSVIARKPQRLVTLQLSAAGFEADSDHSGGSSSDDGTAAVLGGTLQQVINGSRRASVDSRDASPLQSWRDRETKYDPVHLY